MTSVLLGLAAAALVLLVWRRRRQPHSAGRDDGVVPAGASLVPAVLDREAPVFSRDPISGSRDRMEF